MCPHINSVNRGMPVLSIYPRLYTLKQKSHEKCIVIYMSYDTEKLSLEPWFPPLKIINLNWIIWIQLLWVIRYGFFVEFAICQLIFTLFFLESGQA